MGKLIILVAHSRGKENFLRNKYTQLFPSKRYKGKTLTTLIFCWAKVSPSQHWVMVNSQIYFFRNVLKFLELNFFKASADDYFYVLHHHYTAIFRFNWCNRTHYDIQHHKLIDDLLQKQSDIVAMRKRCFEIFWKFWEYNDIDLSWKWIGADFKANINMNNVISTTNLKKRRKNHRRVIFTSSI